MKGMLLLFSRSVMSDFVTLWIAARQASLSFIYLPELAQINVHRTDWHCLEKNMKTQFSFLGNELGNLFSLLRSLNWPQVTPSSSP